MRISRSGSRYLMPLLAGAALAIGMACAGDEDSPTATSPASQPTQSATSATGATPSPTSGTSASPTVGGSLPTATATSAPAENNAPEPKTAAGTITIAVADLDSHPGLNSAQGGEASVFWGVGETLFTTSEGPVFGEPWLAKDWEIASDLSKVTINIQTGVQFHKGHGEMTAEDVAWSINDANAHTNPESIHAQAGDLNAVFDEWKAIDADTVEAPFKIFDPRWQSNALSDGFQPTGIFSKSLFDEMGADWMRQNTIMTGPFEVREWTEGNRAVLDAVEDHWRKTAQVDTVIVQMIPEASVRLAQMRTGEADAASIELKDIPGLVEEGFQLTGTGGATELNIAMAGNLWETTHARTGETLERPGLDTSKPWIGDPADPESMEKAKNVRWALAMAYDREELNEALASGLGWPTYIGYFNPRMPQWQDKWSVSYDVDEAKNLLSQAGYPDGFAIEIFGQSDTRIRAETAEAVGQFWSQNLGLDVSVQSFEYSVFRPTIVDRSAQIPFMNSCDDGRFPRPWDWPVGLVVSSLSRGGFSCAFEAPEIAQLWIQASEEPDLQKRIEINNQVADFMHEWMLMPSTFSYPILVPFNPNAIKEWKMRPSLAQGGFASPENIVPAR